MLRKVEIMVHTVKEPPTNLSFDTDAIHRLFWTAGIDLTFSNGLELEVDPMGTAISYQVLLDYFKNNNTQAGHLVIGRAYPDFRPDVAGQLHDPDRRGLAAVYTSSDYIAQYAALGLIQTAAHEIGHMLNLAHKHVARGFISTMDSAGSRTSEVAVAWQEAALESERVRSNNEEPYYWPLDETNPCYPFAYNARRELNTLADDQLLPWRERFIHSHEDVNDEWKCCRM